MQQAPDSPAPSKVLHLGQLPPGCTQAEVNMALAPYGHVAYSIMLTAKNAALVEMADVEVARRVVAMTASQPLFLQGRPIRVGFSRSPEINRREGEGAGGGAGGGGARHGGGAAPAPGYGRVLLLAVSNAKYPITVDVLEKILRPHGELLRAVVFDRPAGPSALVEFRSPREAEAAMAALQGRDIYDNCCTLRIQVANYEHVDVRGVGDRGRDWTVGEGGGAGRYAGEAGGPAGVGAGGVPGAPGAPGVPLAAATIAALQALSTNPAALQQYVHSLAAAGGVPPGSQGYGGVPGLGPMPYGAGPRPGGPLGPAGFVAPGGMGGRPMGPPGMGPAPGSAPAGAMGGGRVGVPSGPMPGGMPIVGRPGPAGAGMFMPGMGAGPSGGMGGGARAGGAGAGAAGSSGAGGAGAGSGTVSPVVMVYNLPRERMPHLNPDHVFNLFCIYGDVLRIRLLEKAPGKAMVQYAHPASATLAINSLRSAPLCGQRLNVSYSHHPYISPNPSASATAAAAAAAASGAMPPALAGDYRDYETSALHRFKKHAPNRPPNPPCSTLYFGNAAPTLDEARMLSLLTACGAPAPLSVRFLPAREPPTAGAAAAAASGRRDGFVDFPSVELAIEAVLVANNQTIDGHTLRFAFANKASATGSSQRGAAAGGEGGEGTGAGESGVGGAGEGPAADHGGMNEVLDYGGSA